MNDYRAEIDGSRFEIGDLRHPPTRVRVDGRAVEVDMKTTVVRRNGGTSRSPECQVSLLLDGVPHEFSARRTSRGTWEFFAEGVIHVVEVTEARVAKARDRSASAGGRKQVANLKAPMPGLVVSVRIQVGDLVQPGDPLVVVSAMKMENELKATSSGRVATVRVTPGDAVNKNQLLVEFDPPEP